MQTIDGHYTYGAPKAPDYELLTETYTRSIVFNTAPGSESVSVQQVIAGDGSGGWAPTPTHSQTPTYSIQGNPANDPVDDFHPYLWKEITNSDVVTRAYIEGRLSDWQSQTQTFRFATDSSIHDANYSTESNDGHAAVNGGHYRIRNSNPFSPTLPTAVASDDDLWGGNYFAHILVTRRMLMPSLYSETYKTADWVGGSKTLQSYGMRIYNEGFSQEQLSNPITENIWLDDYGIFDDGAGVLAGAPKISLLYPSISPLPYYTGDGKGHEVVFVSRNGRRTRITPSKNKHAARSISSAAPSATSPPAPPPAPARTPSPSPRSTPFSPPSGLATGSFNGLHPKSKFLALNHRTHRHRPAEMGRRRRD